MRPGSRRAAGFTLIELTVVLLIAGLGLAVAVPFVEGGFDSSAVRRAARELVATMHHCRSQAVSRSQPQAVAIDPLQNRVHTSDGKRWASLSERAVIERVEGGVDLCCGVVQVLCFPNGSTSGVDVVLASRRDRTRSRYHIQLDPLVGTTRVLDAGL